MLAVPSHCLAHRLECFMCTASERCSRDNSHAAELVYGSWLDAGQVDATMSVLYPSRERRRAYCGCIAHG